ncbi:MAG: outer membrane beta-barrel protein, partial [Shinella sp.]
MDRGAGQLRLSRRLAGLLLAGTVLASVPALSQEQTPADPTALTDPFAVPAADGGAETPDTTTTTNGVPALTDDQQDALANAADDGAVGRTGSETERLNAPEGSVGGARSAFGDPYEPTGIRLGSFVLRPSVSQGIGYEKTKVGPSSTSRTFSTTGFRGSLTSDWSRHQWTIDGEGVYQRNISGVGETEPELRINSDLRLDLSGNTIANLTAGYSFERESNSDPNATAGASAQSGVHGFTGGARVTRDFGLIRGTIGADLQRETFSSATLANGDKLIMSDRNYTEGTLTGRIGFE